MTRQRKRRVLGCMPVRDMPTPPVPSRMGRCERCQIAVWVGDCAPRFDTIWCIGCMYDEFEHQKDVEFEPPTARQLYAIKTTRTQ